jgi:hypothetical protein
MRLAEKLDWKGLTEMYAVTYSIHFCLNHSYRSPVIFLFPVVLTFSKMHVMFGTMDCYALRHFYMLSKTYRIAVLTF